VALDAETGQPLALIEGSSLTAIRTAAGAGAATDLLARQDARIGVVFGAGVQARTAIRAISAARNLQTIYVIGRNPDKVKDLITDTRGMDAVPEDVRAVENNPLAISRAVSEADIIYCAT